MGRECQQNDSLADGQARAAGTRSSMGWPGTAGAKKNPSCTFNPTEEMACLHVEMALVERGVDSTQYSREFRATFTSLQKNGEDHLLFFAPIFRPKRWHAGGLDRGYIISSVPLLPGVSTAPIVSKSLMQCVLYHVPRSTNQLPTVTHQLDRNVSRTDALAFGSAGCCLCSRSRSPRTGRPSTPRPARR